MTEFFKESDCDCSSMKLDPITGQSVYVRAITFGKANRLLRERSKVVYGRVSEDGLDDFCDRVCGNSDTHQALLINIEPIERDSAESLLKEFTDWFANVSEAGKTRELVTRAKKLLGDI